MNLQEIERVKMFGYYQRKSSKCKNCGEWSFDEKREKDFVLEKKIKNLYEYVNNSKEIPEKEKKYLLENLRVS
jgi:hypothetical protein